MYNPIEDYAIIGNLRSAVLISKDGSIDWAPAPFIDSPSIFAAILDDTQGGYWSIRPKHKIISSHQEYIEGTNVLVTTFKTARGVLEVTDFIPIEEDKTLRAAEEETTFKIKRRIRCRKGVITVRTECVPRFDYARGETTLSPISGGVAFKNNEKRGVLVSERAFVIESATGSAVAEFTLKEGGSEFMIFRYNTGEENLRKKRANETDYHALDLARTIRIWRSWADSAHLNPTVIYKEKWFQAMIRSALTLKILFFEPTGTVAAAATTSLPADIGGIRNWDYRYSWLRDASFTFQALFQLGYTSEARTYLDWLVNVCANTAPENIRIMYGLRGEEELEEYVLPHLAGYENSKPVRVGNGAFRQRQLDVYGSVLDMVWRLSLLESDCVVDRATWRVLERIADYVESVWQEPDEGIWEVRGGKNHFVYSKVMCWVALDRALKLVESQGYGGARKNWERARDVIKQEVCERGFNKEIGAFTIAYDSSDVDAAMLRLSTLGFIEGDDPRIKSTIKVIEERLGCGAGLLKRYTIADGLPGEDGAFLIASFWLVDALVLAGEVNRAFEIFEGLMERRNHVGLFSEGVEPKSGRFTGNFPQAYTHIGLINSAILLSHHLYAPEYKPPEEDAPTLHTEQ